MYNVSSGIRFEIAMLKSSLCDHSNAVEVEGKLTITGAETDAAARQADERSKGIIYKNYAPFINCKNEIDNTKTDNAKDIDKVISMYNLIEYSDII